MEKIFKNILYLVFGIVYFIFYYSWNYSILEVYFLDNIKYWDIILSYITALVWFFTAIWVVALINRGLEYLFKPLR